MLRMNDFLKIFLEALGITIPIFVIIAIGFFIKKKGMIKEENVPFLNSLTYDFGLSTLVFVNITQYKVNEIFNVYTIKVIYSAFFIAILIIFFSFYFLKIENRTRSTLIVASYRSNMAFMGLPMLLYAYGPLAAAKASIVIAFLYPFNIISVILLFKLQYLNVKQNDNKISYSKLVKEIVFDPVIIAVVLGLLISYFNLSIPKPLSKILEILAGMAVPIALISIGASFKFSNVKKNIKYLSLISISKLLIIPLILFLLFTYVFKIGKFDRDIVVMLFAMPLAVSALIQSKKYSSNSDLISSALITTTMFSAVTISAWLFFLEFI